MKKLGILVVLLIVFFLVASASALTHNFGATNGNSEYKGAVAVNKDGSIAVTVVAVADGTLAPTGTISASDAGGAHAGQSNTEIEGNTALALSMASNGGNTATTGDLASGDNAAILTNQGAGADTDGAGAGQHDTTVTGEVAVAGSTAQAADGASAATVAAAEDGTIGVANQGAGAEGSAHAGQDTIIGTVVALDPDSDSATLVTAERAVIASTASDGQGNTASTIAAGTDAVVASFQHVEAEPDDTAIAEQDSLIVAGSGGTGFAATKAKSEDGDSAKTYDIAASGDGILVIAASQGSIAGDEPGLEGAAAVQNSTVAGHAFAAAGSSSKSHDGDKAETVAVAYHGGGIVTIQGAAAGEVSFGPIGPVTSVGVEGAAAAQLSEITAFDGAVARSSASNRHADEGAAETEAAIHGAGNISTIQGAGAGEVDLYIPVDSTGLEIEAEGAVAAQASSMDSNQSGHASSRSTNEFDNFAKTEVGYSGNGFIDDTIQGAAAGEVEVGFGGNNIAEAEGSIAIQHTDYVTSENLDSVWASASSNNEFENRAGTKAKATGNGAFIEDTWQGAGAGEVEIFGHDVAEGAVAIQDTETINSGVDGYASASSWSSNERENFASTKAKVYSVPPEEDDGVGAPGVITDTTQGAAAGEVDIFGIEAEGAVAIQDTEGIAGLNGFAESKSWGSDPVRAETEARFFGVGSIDDTTQGAAAGEVEADIGPIDIKGEGAIAIQHTDSISSDLGGFAASSGFSIPGSDEGSAGTIAGYGFNGSITDTIQGAAVGEAELEFRGRDIIEVDGAVAAQNTELIESDTIGGAASWANNEDENFALTGAVFFGDGEITDTTQGGAAGEIELFGHEVAEGAVVGQFTDYVGSTDGGGAGALSISEDGDFAVTAAAYLTNGSIDNTLVGAAAGEVNAGDVFFLDDVQIEGAAAVQHTDVIHDEFGAFTVSAASQDDADEGFALTTNGFLFGEGTITETTQGAVAGETEFRIHHTNVELEGAAAIQHTDEIDSDGLGWAASVSTNEFDNFAFTADAYTFGGEIGDTTQGAVAGEIELDHHHHDLELEGAAAGQFTDFVHTTGPGFIGTGALHEQPGPDDFDFTGPGFTAPGSTTGPVFGIAAAGEIEDGFHIDGAIAFP